MTKQEVTIAGVNMVKLDCDNERILRPKGSDDNTPNRHITVMPEDVENWEEIAVADLPPYTKDEYNNTVDSFVKLRYSQSEENAIQRKMLNILITPATLSEEDESSQETDMIMAEYAEYNAYVEECKQKAKNPELYQHDKEV